MSVLNITKATAMNRLLPFITAAATLLLSAAGHAAAPGITGTGTVATFNLTAQPSYLTQPDGQMVYAWGYGCMAGSATTFLPTAITTGVCGTMQVPGPTLIVTEGTVVTVNLTNNLPTAAGNTSILFPGFQTVATGGAQGLLTTEAAPGTMVTYKFT